ncbi:MAG: amidophosphoribosyltransferase [Ruminococcus sp.]|nr:amidophosphoribosyltransferase [Ruminococcus sp.]
MNEIHEECGIFGVYAPDTRRLSDMVYYGLYALQHRGQESCGMVVCDDGLFYSHKDLGLVGEVFTKEAIASLPSGQMAVGHVRYGTTGSTNRLNCQPIEVNHCKGRLALAHNGNLTNAYELRARLELSGAIFHTTSDTETIAYIVTQERLTAPSIEEAVNRAAWRLEGAYSLVFMSATKLIAMRDAHGFRPLCYGKTPDGCYVVASESCALGAVGAEFIRDILPGEIVVFDENGVYSIKDHCGKKPERLCVFEYIYFARSDSVINGVSVHAARRKAGELLAKSCPVEADVVIGVPDSGLDAALGYSLASGIPYELGFIKNKYVGRTFIAPTQSDRLDQVRIKLSPISEAVTGKRVIMIDDSIVRGTTSAQIVKLLRNAGATEVHVRISSPPFLNPCYYGTDIDSENGLIACSHTVEEIAEIIGADTLGYLPTEDLNVLAESENICTSCFTGDYPTGIPVHTDKGRFEGKLSEAKPQKSRLYKLPKAT